METLKSVGSRIGNLYDEFVTRHLNHESETLQEISRLKESLVHIDFSFGNPICDCFPPAAKAGARAFYLNTRSYPRSRGIDRIRDTVSQYATQELFNGARILSRNNVIPGIGTTHLYFSIARAFLNEGEVCLVTAPGYGIFSYISEEGGACTYSLLLKKSNRYRFLPTELRMAIEEINGSGRKVKAFLFMNPHNPTGNVYSREDELIEIGRVLKEKHILIIEDMAYMGTEFDQGQSVKPICLYCPELFDQTITLLSLSKAYGMAAIRAAIAISSEENIQIIKTELSKSVDSVPIPQQEALAATFAVDFNISRARIQFLSKNAEEYQYRTALMVAMIDGVEHIDHRYRQRVVNEVTAILGMRLSVEILSGINGVEVEIIPSSGFFLPVSFAGWKGLYFAGKKIETCHDLIIDVLAQAARVLVLPGSAMMWPNNDWVVRMSLVPESLDESGIPPRSNIIIGLKRVYEIGKQLSHGLRT
ncbi:hypothetical protein BTA51_09140 [Hahella sp. CCB-MM4]|uniref:pyridoxal phosphate-dependent aminotransferase n=1 Tax=Hahella sp. (strain CCB-MM4) TaxID=1926491 RepID=UPI000B9AE5A6|nr:pyridoxal phosphate-dependent aminotransferase [Hahella sp. CCB-MM4]OZG73935.1 hypothetical protein BTA51_09140 [Hahella sp. CCB-MM4]